MEDKNINKTLLILDLDETLIHASSDRLNNTPDFKIFDFWIYKRPYLDKFINSIKEDFLLGVWSSASDDYVVKVIDKIIPSNVDLEFIWGRNRCTYKRNFDYPEEWTDDTASHYHYIKPLKKLRKKGFSLKRMLIIDDSPHKCQENYGNAIYPTPFIGDETDAELLYLSKYLNRIKDVTDVRRFEKRNWKQKAMRL